MGGVILEIRNLSNYFGMVCTARDLDLDIESGVLTSIIGPNGAGKSTLINLITGNLPVQSGTIRFRGQNVTHLPIHQRVRLGICRSFQIVNIFPELTVLENIMIPTLALSGRAPRIFSRVSGERAALKQVDTLLEKVGLGGVRTYPGQCPVSWRSASLGGGGGFGGETGLTFSG